jgi:hypothetical protein
MSNRGKPAKATSDDNRCEALAIMTEWKRSNKREERCPFMAKWAVQGHQFCMHHARVQAVAICVEKGLMRRLAAPIHIAGQRVRLSKP